MSRNRERNRQQTQSQQDTQETFQSSTESTNLNEKVEILSTTTPPQQFEPGVDSDAVAKIADELETERASASAAFEAEAKAALDGIATAPRLPVSEQLADLYNQAAADLRAEAQAQPVEIPIGQVLPPAVPHDPYELPLSVSASSRLTVSELKHYIEKMSSRVRMPSEEGGALQGQLYHILVQAINTREEDFDVVFGLVTKMIRDNLEGVFSMTNVHRYTPYITLPSKTVAHFRYLVSVLTAMVDPTLRGPAARQTNLDQAFRTHNIKEAARQRVLNFFNL